MFSNVLQSMALAQDFIGLSEFKEGIGVKCQGAFHVTPTPKLRQALNFCTPGIFRKGEAAKI